MTIKITGVTNTTNYLNQQNRQPQTKYYKPQATKETIKKDFGLLLDAEIKQLSFDVYV